MPRKHDRSALLANIRDLLDVVDQLPSVIFWRIAFQGYSPSVKYSEQAYRGVARACLESTLISLRCLDEFFRIGGQEDAIRAEDYPSFRTRGGFLDPTKRDRISMHIAHFTVSRATNHVLFWSYKKEIFDAVRWIVEFLDYLCCDFLTPDDDVLPRVKAIKDSLCYFVFDLGATLDFMVERQ